MSEDMSIPPEELERLHAVIGSVHAPAGLRARVAATAAGGRRRRTPVRRVAVAATAGVAAAAAAVVLAGGGGPTVLEAAALRTAAATAPAPPADPARPKQLALAVGGVHFPAWTGTPWRATGRRTDTLHGRRAATVFYDGPGSSRIAYTIVAGDALAWPDGARTVRRGGAALRAVVAGGARIVTWRERGHQCVLAAPLSVPRERLVALAAQRAAGSADGYGA